MAEHCCGTAVLCCAGSIDRAELARRLAHHRMSPKAYVPWEHGGAEPLQIKSNQPTANQALTLQWLNI